MSPFLVRLSLLSLAKFPTTSTKVTNTNTKYNKHRNVHVRKCSHKHVFLGRQTLALFQSNFEIQMITQTLKIANSKITFTNTKTKQMQIGLISKTKIHYIREAVIYVLAEFVR